MIDPTICSLLKKVEDRYTLCILVGKRARQLTNGAQKFTDRCRSQNAVAIATSEVDEDIVTFIRTKSGIK